MQAPNPYSGTGNPFMGPQMPQPQMPQPQMPGQQQRAPGGSTPYMPGGQQQPDMWSTGPLAGVKDGQVPQGFWGGAPGQQQAPTGQQPQAYGYGTAPNSSNRGAYEQQTPAGSYIAADQQRAGQQMATTSTASNPFIGQTTQQVQGAPSVAGAAAAGQYANPWLGQTAQQAQGAGTNAYAGPNAYLEDNIQSAQDETRKQYELTTAPAFDRAQAASGSFGNAGIEQMRQASSSDLAKQLGSISSGMRMQDYTAQQQLGENALNRTQQLNLNNAAMGQADLTRNLAGGFTQNGQNTGMMYDAAKFDASNNFAAQTANQGANAGDLGRNTNAALGLGTFNAGALNQGSQFNAGQGNQIGQFNASQGNAMNQNNASAGNQMLESGRTRAQQADQFGRTFSEGQRQYDGTRADNRYQFDENLDRGIYNDNQGWANQGQQNQIALLQSLYGLNSGAVTQAGNIQNTPLDYYQQFANTANGIAGNGQQNSQNMQGNPWLGAVGGFLTATGGR